MVVSYTTDALAGEVAMSKEEVLEWCREWAKDKEYVTLGQNCWHMVYTFLSTHEGCEISESLKCVSSTVCVHPKNAFCCAYCHAHEHVAYHTYSALPYIQDFANYVAWISR